MRDVGRRGWMKMGRLERCMSMMRHVFFLTCLAAMAFSLEDSASAARIGRDAGPARPFAGRPFVPRAVGAPHTTFAGLRSHGFNHPPGATPGQQLPHGVDHGPAGSGQGRALPHGLEHGPAGPAGSRPGRALPHGLEHGPAGLGRTPPRGPSPSGPAAINAIARNGLPHRPFPGQPGFTGVPPRGETRFVSNEMVVHVGAEVSPQALDAAARRLGLTPIGSQNLALSGGRLVHFRIPNGQVADAVRMLEAEKIGIAQPNYVFQLQQDAHAAAPPSKGDPAQYVIDKLHLHDAHGIASATFAPDAMPWASWRCSLSITYWAGSPLDGGAAAWASCCN